MLIISVIFLALRTMLMFPEVTPRNAVAVSIAAVANQERTGIPASVIVVIAYGESRVQPNVASWVVDGKRKDLVWTGDAQVDGVARLPARVVCGYLQAMTTGDECVALMQTDGAMARGLAELEQWQAERCGGDFVCVVRGHACGNVGIRGGCPRADHYLRQAARLDHYPLWPTVSSRAARAEKRTPRSRR